MVQYKTNSFFIFAFFFLIVYFCVNENHVWSELHVPLGSQSPTISYALFFQWQILVCAFIIYLYREISISCAIPNESSFPPSRAYSFIPLVLVCSFRLFHHIIYKLLHYSWRIFLTSVSWWAFSGVWVTASRLKSPGLFSVFWLIFTM